MKGDPCWELYPETVLEFPATGLRIDLRTPLSAEAVSQLRALGVGNCFAIVTPCDPRGVRATDGTNATRVSALRASLERQGCRFILADGASPDRQHREPGFALEIPLEDAVTLARVLEQSALFWFDGDGFWLVPVLVRAESVRLPRGRTVVKC